MKYFLKRLGMFTGLMLLCVGQSAAQIEDGLIHQKDTLPNLTDWFLSTGDWHQNQQLYIKEIGNGTDTVIMLHGGWGGDHAGLVGATQGLTDDYRFIFYDQRGSLRSPFPDSLITYDHHIEDLELLRKELNISKLSIVAHSMGTILASAYAQKYPKHVKKLVLIAPAYLKNPIPEEDITLLNQEQQAFQTFLNRPELTQELNRYHLLRSDPPLSSREETSKFRISFAARMLYDVANWHQLQGGRALYKGKVFQLTAQTYPAEGWDFPGFFNSQQFPIHVIQGDHDFLDFGGQLISKWMKDIPTVQLTSIPKAGHVVWIDQAESFRNALAKALK